MVFLSRRVGAGLGSTAMLLWALGGSVGWPGLARAESVLSAGPQNVLQLSSSGSVEVTQDWLTLTLGLTREGSDAAVVQAQLRTALDAGLVEARKSVQAGQVELRTGAFNLFPRYNRDGKINGWQGTAELVLEGRDVPRLTATAARITSLNVTQVQFSLSREQRARVEGEAQAQAVERFKARATELSRQFGFSSYVLREVNVSSSDAGSQPRPRMMAMEAKAAAPMAADLPVEAGRSTVNVNVSGSVQMR
ncbi:SIMPL domain-containing protein [Curvibacter sp. HBC61]|uniref:SIMPL domain-containing protein n=1 Tax=Curvibacter cyanobacteriorum TaxID=3026422 RepID=A0ABT5MV93_9BURK|nr:SIMPL domain-containing protein [Curvibacter sp. HBC61]MDD0837733.1 SIMPL domain-containing protein [Curvibacter sp. HBC61]